MGGGGQRAGERRAEYSLTFIIHYAWGLHDRRHIPRLIAFRVLPKPEPSGLFIQAKVEEIRARSPARLDHLDSHGIIAQLYVACKISVLQDWSPESVWGRVDRRNL